jgi:hypothetical protein
MYVKDVRLMELVQCIIQWRDLVRAMLNLQVLLTEFYTHVQYIVSDVW